MKFIKIIVSFFVLVTFVQCSPEFQMSVQKYIYDANINEAIKIAKVKFPDKDIILKRDSIRNMYIAQSDVFQYQLTDISDSTRNLNRALEWMLIAEIIKEEGHKWIDKGYLVIKSKRNKEEVKPDKVPDEK